MLFDYILSLFLNTNYLNFNFISKFIYFLIIFVYFIFLIIFGFYIFFKLRLKQFKNKNLNFINKFEFYFYKKIINKKFIYGFNNKT